MSEVPKYDGAAPASGDATNPFAPIDYTSRLKAPTRHTGAFHAMQPLQPGQLYGTAHWMSPPKPLSPSPAPQESVPVLLAQDTPAFPASFPAGAGPSPAAQTSEGMPSAPSASGIPPYLKRRPALGSAAAQTQPPHKAGTDAYIAADAQRPFFSAEAAPEPPAQPARPSAGHHPASRNRRSRVARHQPEEAAAPDTAAESASASAVPPDTLPPVPEMPSGFSCQPLWDVSPTPESPLFPAGGEPGAPYAPPLQPGKPYPSDLPEEPAPFPQATQPSDEIDAFFSAATEEPSMPEEPAKSPAPPLRDPFTPALHAHDVPEEDVHSRVSTTDAPASPPPRRPSHPAPSPEAARPQRPPVRPARVAALMAAFLMLVFCLVQGSRILTDLARNEREMEEVRQDYLERTGMELQSGAARVDLLPAGQTYVPSPTPALTQAVQTPSPTPIIPIRENAIQSLNKRDTSNVQEVSAPTDTPSLRSRLTEYPGNPLKNVMESLLPLIEENGEVVGKLTIPGVLEEVVVQRNNTYYLTHNYRGGSSDAGAVFVDESCSLRSPPENLLLRGQSAVEGKVFAPLWQYATAGRDFVASATTAHLTTLYEEADYVLFAVIVASSLPSSPDYFNYAGYPSFVTDADMLSYVEAARAHSLYSFNVDVTASDRLLTLATLGSGTESLVLLYRQMR